MLSDEDDYFLRDYEVPSELSLTEFHDFICDDLQYRKNTAVSFFTADARWNRSMKFPFTETGDGGEPHSASMRTTRLCDVIRRYRDRLVYCFDPAGNRAFYLEAIDAEERQPERNYPRVMFSNGEPPDQFDPEKPTGNRSIFDEAMGDFNEFEGNDSYDEDDLQ